MKQLPVKITYLASNRLALDRASPDDSFSAVLAGDGETAVAAFLTGDDAAVHIFGRSGDSWTAVSEFAVPLRDEFSSGDCDVAVSRDGRVVAVKTPRRLSSRSGNVCVFTLAEDGPLLEEVGCFGHSVDLSGDGNVLAVGARGVVRLFERTSAGWRECAAMSAPVLWESEFGHSVSLSADGETLVVGAFAESVGGVEMSGAVYVFEKTDGVWGDGVKLTARDLGVRCCFGYSVDLSADGETLAVGAYGANSDDGPFVGAVYVFTRSGSTWTQQAKLTASAAQPVSYFGWSVDLSDSGDVLAVGAPLGATTGDSSESGGRPVAAGITYVFSRDAGDWREICRATPSTGKTGDQFGLSVSASGDGETVLAVSSEGEESERICTAYVFDVKYPRRPE